jgi:hypothetical protein
MTQEITDAMLDEQAKTPAQLRAGRRRRLSVGKEPMTDEAIIFMFMEKVEAMMHAIEIRERHNRSAKKHGYMTHLGRSAQTAEIYMKDVYPALERLRTRLGITE